MKSWDKVKWHGQSADASSLHTRGLQQTSCILCGDSALTEYFLWHYKDRKILKKESEREQVSISAYAWLQVSQLNYNELVVFQERSHFLCVILLHNTPSEDTVKYIDLRVPHADASRDTDHKNFSCLTPVTGWQAKLMLYKSTYWGKSSGCVFCLCLFSSPHKKCLI